LPFLIYVLSVEKREPQKLEVDKMKYELRGIDCTVVVESEPSVDGGALS
jgi:hypothetical protein